MNKNYAIFVDLENAGGKSETLKNIIEKVKMRGDILLAKVYGYKEEFSELKELLLSNTFSVVPSLRYGRNQKNNLDIQLVIDALDVAYTNDLIDCYCIVSGDSDYTPLVGKLKTMGKYVLGISRSEVASRIFISACNEFLFMETVRGPVAENRPKGDEEDDLQTLAAEIRSIILEQEGDDEGYVHASALKNTLIRLRPDFSEKNYGFRSFGKLLAQIQKECGSIECKENGKILKVRLVQEQGGKRLDRENFRESVQPILQRFKETGFDRVNPSIIKQTILESYPDFDERDIGVKRFSDVMRLMRSWNMLEIEFDDNRCMIAKIM
jgi:uncharacterized LabA/DUF88 family protein